VVKPRWLLAGAALLASAGLAGAVVVASPGGEEEAVQQVESPTPTVTPSASTSPTGSASAKPSATATPAAGTPTATGSTGACNLNPSPQPGTKISDGLTYCGASSRRGAYLRGLSEDGDQSRSLACHGLDDPS
jgi:hypothetical protein